MERLIRTYLRYGVPSGLAHKFAHQGLAATTFRTLSLSKLFQAYGVPAAEAARVKKLLARQPIDDDVLQRLLENSNFTCCCCKGVKADSYVVHHIVPYSRSQDNGYDNLAVLCPNDHELAHRPSPLVSGITADQVRASKASWEQTVRIHNLAAAGPDGMRRQAALIPRYQQLQGEIDTLRSRIADKEKLVERTDALLDAEVFKNRARISELEAEKASLEAQVADLARHLARMDPDTASAAHAQAVDLFLAGDLAGALRALDEAELDARLEEYRARRSDLAGMFQQNVDDRLFRARLLTVEGSYDAAKESAGNALRVCEELVDLGGEGYLPELARCFESVGTIYFNVGSFDAAEACFVQGLQVCRDLQDAGNLSLTPLVPLLLQNIGAAYHNRGDAATALEYLENAADWYAGLAETYSGLQLDLPGFHYEYAKTLTNLGTTYTALGRHDDARRALEGAQRELGTLPASLADETDPTRVEHLSSLVSLSMRTDDLDAAADHSRELIPILRERAQTGRALDVERLAEAVLNLCSIQVLTGDAEAEASSLEAEGLFRELAAAGQARAEVRLAAALLYRATLKFMVPEDAAEVRALALEARALTERYPDDAEAIKLLESVEILLTSTAPGTDARD